MCNSLVPMNFKCREKKHHREEKKWAESLSTFSPEDVSPVQKKEHLHSLGSLSMEQGVKRPGPWLQP